MSMDMQREYERKLKEHVMFFKGLKNSSLSKEIMTVLNEYFGCRPKFDQIIYGNFGDGEYDDRFIDYKAISGKTVVMFECLKDADTTMRFLQLCWAAKHQYGAENVIAVLYFMHYRRQDRESCFHEIWRNKWLADQMKLSGISHVVLVTPHSEQTKINLEKNAITVKIVDLSKLFANRLRPFIYDSEKVVVYAPDEGSIVRAIALAEELKLGVIFSLKSRGFDNEIEVAPADQEKVDEIKKQFQSFPNLEYATPNLVNGATIIIVEDEVDTGGGQSISRLCNSKNMALKKSLFFSLTQFAVDHGGEKFLVA